MTRTFVFSDPHFGQDSLYKYSHKHGHVLRPEFASAEEADKAMVHNFNNVVPEFDSTVYFLGDISKNITTAEKYISQLNGTRKILVMGNHDAKYVTARLAKLFDKLLGVTYVCDKKYVLTHVPVHPCELRGMINCHGHVHRNTINDSRYINASVEVNNYYPIEIN